MTTTLQTVEELTAGASNPAPTMPQVLPEETPLAMPEQDLAISPLVIRAYRLIRAPGHAIRIALPFKRRHRQDSHHVA